LKEVIEQTMCLAKQHLILIDNAIFIWPGLGAVTKLELRNVAQFVFFNGF